MPHYTAAVTLLVVGWYFFLATRVPLARQRFGVKLSAITGHPDFERIFRIHQNTLEWLPIFLLPLWLCAFYLSDVGAAVLCLPGFFIQSSVCLLLFIGAVVGLVMHW